VDRSGVVVVSGAGLKRLLVGAPRPSGQLNHTLLPKWMALPVFSSDPMSSTAYATQEMMLVLILAGTGAFANIMPLSIAVALLLTVVVLSYRQTVRAYPRGGGSYIVSRENLGDLPGLLAAAAILIDYTLTVSVSIAAGVDAIISAVPDLAPERLLLALAFVALVTLVNLRGVKEAGLLFALPTYLFITVMFVMILWGLAQCATVGCPQAPSAGLDVPIEESLGLLLLLRAFSSGATALTGVEAISDGVPAFRYPQSRNAAATLGIMGTISVSMFLGISFLADRTNVIHEEGGPTVTSEIAQAVFGGRGFGFYLVQVVTAAILILAANTAYADFPRLASVLARDRFLPRQFTSRGDRLVFSNGVLVLAVVASLLLILFQASVTSLIQLYVVGVFTAFTLSQTGMVLHHRRVREPGWQRGAVINGLGALTTGVVLVVVTISKFALGAWIVIVAMPVLAYLMWRIRAHYARISVQLRADVAVEEPPRPQHVCLVLDRVDEAMARGISYALAVRAASITAFAVPIDDQVVPRFRELAPDIEVREIAPLRSRGSIGALRRALADEAARRPDGTVTALVAETQSRNWTEQLRDHWYDLRIKRALLDEGDLVVTDVTSLDTGGPPVVEEPVEHHVVVLASAANKATLRAIAFAKGLHGTTTRALSVNLDTERSTRILHEWEDWGVDLPLELVDSPFRSLSDSLREYVRAFRPDGRRVVVTCVLPEFVLPRWYHAPLHNQTALLIKNVLLFERGVVTTSVPYHLPAGDAGQDAGEGRGSRAGSGRAGV